jgi:glycosyltransferase involved in cell wall biosynthesis
VKIAIVHSYYGAGPSGENDVVDSQAMALRDAGHSVELIARRTDDLVSKRLYKVKSGLTVASGFGPSPLKRLKDFQPDIVHVHNLFPNWGTSWLRQWEGPVVATLHNFRSMCPSGVLFRDGSSCTLCIGGNTLHAVKYACYKESRVATLPIAIASRGGVTRNELLNRANKVVLLSSLAKDQFVSAGLNANKIAMIPNFVSPSRIPKVELSSSYLFAGRLSAEKGILELASSWPDGPKLLICGDGPLRPQLEGIVSYRKNIELLGMLSKSEVRERMSSATGLIFSSLWLEGLPTVYLEALAAGLPVIAKSGSSVAVDVLDSGAGLVFETWNQLAGHTESLEAHRDAMSGRALSSFKEKYSTHTWLLSMESCYRELLSKGS